MAAHRRTPVPIRHLCTNQRQITTARREPSAAARTGESTRRPSPTRPLRAGSAGDNGSRSVSYRTAPVRRGPPPPPARPPDGSHPPPSTWRNSLGQRRFWVPAAERIAASDPNSRSNDAAVFLARPARPAARQRISPASRQFRIGRGPPGEPERRTSRRPRSAGTSSCWDRLRRDRAPADGSSPTNCSRSRSPLTTTTGSSVRRRPGCRARRRPVALPRRRWRCRGASRISKIVDLGNRRGTSRCQPRLTSSAPVMIRRQGRRLPPMMRLRTEQVHRQAGRQSRSIPPAATAPRVINVATLSRIRTALTGRCRGDRRRNPEIGAEPLRWRRRAAEQVRTSRLDPSRNRSGTG